MSLVDKGFSSRPTKTPFKSAIADSWRDWATQWTCLKGGEREGHRSGRLSGILAGIVVGFSVDVSVVTLAGILVGLLWNPFANVCRRRAEYGFGEYSFKHRAQ